MLDSIAGIQDSLWECLGQTAWMTAWSSLISLVLGGLIGLYLYLTSSTLFNKTRVGYQVASVIVNIISSVPFMILMIFVLPLSALIVGTKIGTNAVIVPLSIAGVAFFARLAEGSFEDVDAGVIEAAIATGASKGYVIWRALLPEALPSLVKNLTVTVVTLLGFSAMAGLIGGGGIGDLAYRYGYQRYQFGVMLVCVIVLVVIVQALQLLGSAIAKHADKRQAR